MRSARVSKAAFRRPGVAARLAGGALWGGASVGLLVTLLGWLSRWSWQLGLLEHFRVQIAVAALLVTVAAAVARRLGPAALAALAVMLNVAAIAPTWFSPERPTHHGEPLSLLVLNVQEDNRDHARVARFLAGSDADIVGLLEMDSRWVHDLEPTMAAWPYRMPQPHDKDKFGLALYSRRPFRFREVRTFGVSLTPAIVATIEMDGAPVTLVLVHPAPPVSSQMAEVQRRFLDALADARPTLGEHVVVMGDMNATPWSYPLRRLRARTGLADSRRGFGLETSWPTATAALRIPIDHVLVSPRIVVLERAVGPAVGSDHFPVQAQIALVR